MTSSSSLSQDIFLKKVPDDMVHHHNKRLALLQLSIVQLNTVSKRNRSSIPKQQMYNNLHNNCCKKDDLLEKTALQPCVCHVTKPLFTEPITETYREKQLYSHVSVMLSILCLPNQYLIFMGKTALQSCV